VILGTLCGLQTVKKIHQWAKSERVKDFLRENFSIYTIPCYFWLLALLKLIYPKSLNQRFTTWSTTLLPKSLEGMTMSFDGKTVCSTGKMSEYDKPLHILSCHLAELGLTVSQQTVSEKSNEIPAMRELLELIDVSGCMCVADALHCQTETAAAVIKNGGDYLFEVKDNQEVLKDDIETYVQDPDLRATMDTETTREKNGGRIEVRTGLSTNDINWQ
jgi:predicted transposase YbfD/YdcC